MTKKPNPYCALCSGTGWREMLHSEPNFEPGLRIEACSCITKNMMPVCRGLLLFMLMLLALLAFLCWFFT